MVNITGGQQLLNVPKILDKLDIAEGMKVADLGCGGTGYFILESSKRVGKKGIVYAVDILKTVLEGIESKAKLASVTNIQTVWSNLETYQATAIPNDSLDMAYLVNTLFLSKKQPEMIKETARMLKKEGKLLVIDWKKSDAPFGPPTTERVDEESVKKILQESGLSELEQFDAGKYHFGLIYIKL